jgi:hypothetical protein
MFLNMECVNEYIQFESGMVQKQYEVAFLTMMNIFSRGWAMLVSVQVVGS